MNIPKACFFDLDGVLLDTEPIHEKAWQKSALAYGKELTNIQLHGFKGRRRIDCAKKIVELIDKGIEIQDFLRTHNSIVSKMINNAKPIEGAENLVNSFIRLEIPIALVSSSSTQSFKLKSKGHKWLELFTIKVLGDDPLLKEGKPSPDPYLLAAKKVNVSPKDSWAIEDSLAGANSAAKAGCKVWLLKDKISTSNAFNKHNINSSEKNETIDKLETIKRTLEVLIQSA